MFVVIIVLSYLLMILSFSYTYFIKYIIDNISNLDKVIILVFVFISIFKIIFTFIINLASDKITRKINLELTNSIIKSLINLPYLYYSNYTTGEIVSRYNDIESIKNIIGASLNIIISIPYIIIMICYMLSINLKLGLIIILITFIYLLFYYFYNKKLLKFLINTHNMKAKYNSYLVESLKNYESIKAINITGKIMNKLVLSNKELENNLYCIRRYQSKNNILFLLLTLLTPLVFLGYYSRVTPGSIFLMYYIFNSIVEPLIQFVDFIIDYKESSFISRKIDEFKVSSNEGKVCPKNYDIRFDNLNYKIGMNHILKNVNLEIKQGSKVFILGESGSGKSTLVKLIKGFYKSIHLYIGDTRINRCSKDKIIYAGQDDRLFIDTILNNLFVSKDSNVIKMCMVNKDESFLVEEDGFNISGGERARIILARALAREFEILILDETLESVDVNMERIILKNIFNNYKDKTIIVISHRLDNLDLFDTLLKVENGYVNHIRYLN